MYSNDCGETIYLFDIERAILDVESVRQCKTVVSEIDGRKTHVAHVVFYQDQYPQDAILEQIKEVCQRKLSENHYPHLFRLYSDALPVAPSGKLDVVKMEIEVDNLINL